MITDLRRRLISILRISEESTDSQLLAAAKALITQRDVYRDLHARSWAPVEVKWGDESMARIGALIVGKGGGKVWMLTGRDTGEDGIAIEVTGPDGVVASWTMRPDDTVTVLAPIPETAAKALLMSSELGAKYQEAAI